MRLQHIRNGTSDGALRVGTGRARPGFTLLELLIVLAVITTLVGLSWPRMSGLLKEQRIKDDAEMVRLQLDRARVQAVDKGIAYQFRYEPEGRKFVLLPYEVIGMTDPNSTMLSPDESGRPAFPVFELSEESRFHVPRSLTGQSVFAQPLGSPWIDYLHNPSQFRDISWSEPIVYYPDGTADDALVTVVDDDKRLVDLSVRGLTGTVSVSPVGRLQEMFDGY